jgi:hypothetical protein
MTSGNIETLLKAANSSPDNDSSVNVAKRTFLNESDARAFFEETKNKLFQIAEWRKNSSATTYELFDESGRVIESGRMSEGNFIRIALYGGGKFDWVRVVAIVDTDDEIILKVKPSYDPTSDDKESTSHFFGPEAENNFCVRLDGSVVAFYVIGLHERTNTAFTDGLIESARNAAVANIGYYSGLQKAVWKQFSKNFLAIDEG